MMNKNGRRPEVDTRHVEMENIIAKMTTLNWGGKSNSQFEALMKAEQEFLVGISKCQGGIALKHIFSLLLRYICVPIVN